MRAGALAVLSVLLLAGCTDPAAPQPDTLPQASGTVPTPVEGTQEAFDAALALPDVVFADGFETGLIPPWTAKQQIYPISTLPDSPLNAVEQTTDVVHSGKSALRTFAHWSRVVDPHPDASTASKADIMNTKLDFKPGDDEWFSGWFFLAEAQDAHGIYFADFEAPNAGDTSPGLRLATRRPDQPGGPAYLYMNAKDFGDSLEPLGEVPVPIGRWFNLVVHIALDTEDGRIRTWQDGILILDGRRPTIPDDEAVYSNLQVGLTANNGFWDHTLYVDDVVVGRTPAAIGWPVDA